MDRSASTPISRAPARLLGAALAVLLAVALVPGTARAKAGR